MKDGRRETFAGDRFSRVHVERPLSLCVPRIPLFKTLCFRGPVFEMSFGVRNLYKESSDAEREGRHAMRREGHKCWRAHTRYHIFKYIARRMLAVRRCSFRRTQWLCAGSTPPRGGGPAARRLLEGV